MMTGSTNVTTMGERTCGSSGNPRIVHLPLDMTVSVPRWIDYLPDGTPLDDRGFQPQIRFHPKPGAFEGERDDLLSAALDHLRKSSVSEHGSGGAASGEQGVNP
jgi:C-terminal processing protease CtpA/Prc